MPRRTNWFQTLIRHVEDHWKGVATVTESEMLKNRATGEESEVDIVVRGTIASHELVVCLECKYSGGSKPRKQDVEWVQHMMGKHADLPTNKLILVSSSGFTKGAVKFAVAHDIALRTFSVVKKSEVHQFLSALERVWLRNWSASVKRVFLDLAEPDPDGHTRIETHPEISLFDVDGALIVDCLGLAVYLMRSERTKTQLGANADPNMVWFECSWNTEFIDELHGLYLRHNVSNKLLRVVGVHLHGPYKLDATNSIPWQFGKYDEMDVAWANSTTGDEPYLVLATIQGNQAKLSLHSLRPE